MYKEKENINEKKKVNFISNGIELKEPKYSKEIKGSGENKDHSKKRKFKESVEEILQDPDSKLSKGLDDLNVKSDSEYLSEGTDENVIEEEESLNSEDYEEQEISNIVSKKKVDKSNKKVKIYDNGKLKKDEELDFDNEAYEMLHRSKPEWPCMSIDFIIPENFYPPVKSFYAENRKMLYKDNYPYTCYLVAGSQTNGYDGYLYLMKWFNMKKTKYDDDPDISLDNSNSENGSKGDDPSMRFERVKINGNINRIKSMKNSYLSAYWTDKGTVEIVDTRSLINEIESSNKEENEDLLKQTNKKKKLVQKNITVNSFKRKLEGFGLDWSPFDDYALAAGGHDKILEIYAPKDEMCSEYSVKFSINKAHLDSIEDIAFSPFDIGILATCSIDRSIKLWDQRMSTVAMNIQNAHKSDVNVIAFNQHSYQVDKTTGKAKNVLLASGGDDGCIKVWDTRRVSSTDYIDNIEWHKGPITSLSWDPFDDTQLAVASEDNSLSIWDFAVEPDDNQLFDYSNKQIPQQLVFLHQGQQNIKDLKFHPLFKNLLVTTAENGINLFKPNFEDEGDYEEEIENEENEEMDIDD